MKSKKNKCKKIILAILLIFSVGISACGYDEPEIYEVSNRFFTQQMHGIMFNSENFVGRTIRYEGVFMRAFCDIVEGNFYYVAQYGDDCCGGGIIGFEIYLDEPLNVEVFTWVEVTGVLEEHHIDGIGDIMRLNVVSMVEVEEPRP